MGIILASKSPRRRELLETVGIRDFKIIPAAGEKAPPEGLTPGQTVEAIAREKAESVSAACGSDDIIIAADTLVYLDGRPLGKPKGAAQAGEMLRALSGRDHTVYTGVAAFRGDRRLVSHEATEVYFRQLADREIDAYIATGEPMDKAGAYGIQGVGAIFIEKIAGDYFNVMGLPLCRLSGMLAELGYTVLTKGE